jgi:hypothetical protein
VQDRLIDSTPHSQQCTCGRCIDSLLHRLWSKAVGSADYDKEEWKRLAAYVEKNVYGSKP